MHCDQHDDKKEQYTLGILLRNTKEHEASRGLIRLKNKNKGGVMDSEETERDSKYEYGF